RLRHLREVPAKRELAEELLGAREVRGTVLVLERQARLRAGLAQPAADLQVGPRELRTGAELRPLREALRPPPECLLLPSEEPRHPPRELVRLDALLRDAARHADRAARASLGGARGGTPRPPVVARVLQPTRIEEETRQQVRALVPRRDERRAGR